MNVGVVEDVLMQVEVVEALGRQHHANIITCGHDLNSHIVCDVTCERDMACDHDCCELHYTVSIQSFLQLTGSGTSRRGVQSGQSVHSQ